MFETADTVIVDEGVMIAAPAAGSSPGMEAKKPSGDMGILDLAFIRVETTVSSNTSEIAVVITNDGVQSAQITQLEPALSMTARGVVNFTRLLEEGYLTLEPGNSVQVTMTPRGLLPEAAYPAYMSASILAAQLCQTFKVVTAQHTVGRLRVLKGVRMI